MLLCVLLSGPLAAEASQTMRFHRLTIADGLSQSNVQAIVQDDSGLLWIATEDGLDRFDGYTFRHYRRDRFSEHALESDFIADLAVDDEGNVWAATDGGGVARWNAATDTFTSFRHEAFNSATISDDHVRALAIDGHVVWIGTRSNGLDRFDTVTGEITHFRHQPADPSTLSNDEVYALALDGQGGVWVATHGGLNRLDTDTGEVTRHQQDPVEPGSVGANIVEAVYVDRAGTVWAGTHDSGLSRFEPDSRTFTRYQHAETDPSSLSHDRVQAMFEDSDGRFWVGTAGGLNLMDRDTGTFSRHHHDATDPSSLSGDNIVSLFQDRSGVLWIGTKVNGLNSWNPRSWSFGHRVARPGETGDLSSSLISAFTTDKEGNLWVGTFGGGINIIDAVSGEVGYLRSGEHGISDDRIMALLTDRAGNVWAGMMGGGLNRIDSDSGQVRVFRHDPDNPRSLGANGIMNLFEDQDGHIWVGTFGGGVSVYDPVADAFTNHAQRSGDPYSLSGNRATAIVQDQYRIIWVGTDGGGLNALDPSTGRWQHFQHDSDDPSSLSDNTIYSLHVDRIGRLWIGTRAGLDRLKRDGKTGAPQAFSSITQRDGLANDTIYGVRSDRAGNIWVSTNYGLSRYDPRQESIRNFHVSHGLQGEEFNFGAHYADKEGRLYFGGTNGYNSFDPARLELHSAAPSVLLTSFLKQNSRVIIETPYERLESLQLGYDDSVVTFEFAATDYVASAQNRFQYMLEGFNRSWIDAGRERRITFTNLDAGRYRLVVRAANSDGTWSEQPFTLPIRVTPPMWRTWWAYLFYGLVAAFALYLLVRHQRQKLEREAKYNRRLKAEVADRTHELADRNAELEVVNRRLHEASHTDALTGLRNRRYLFDEISKDIHLVQRHHDASSRGGRRSDNGDIVFIVVDLDGFKPVNDSLGHLAGDQLLLEIRDALMSACRSSDVVIRWGGDEFLIVARGTSRDDASQLVERIRQRIENCGVELDNGHAARTTCSVGFAAYPFLKDRPELFAWEQVLAIADAAMYRAKRRRNGFCGIYGVQWSDTAERLLDEIKRDAVALAELGVIEITDSSLLADEDAA